MTNRRPVSVRPRWSFIAKRALAILLPWLWLPATGDSADDNRLAWRLFQQERYAQAAELFLQQFLREWMADRRGKRFVAGQRDGRQSRRLDSQL